MEAPSLELPEESIETKRKAGDRLSMRGLEGLDTEKRQKVETEGAGVELEYKLRAQLEKIERGAETTLFEMDGIALVPKSENLLKAAYAICIRCSRRERK